MHSSRSARHIRFAATHTPLGPRGALASASSSRDALIFGLVMHTGVAVGHSVELEQEETHIFIGGPK
jgi:hypothetical protein